MDQKRTDLMVRAENSFLVHVSVPGDPYGKEDPLAELRNLAYSAGSHVMGEMVQQRLKPHPNQYIGKGKMEELDRLCKERDVDVVICDDDLTPGQVRNMENALKRKVVDRSELILDIFALHARTYQSRLAVELAQLEYTLPRLKRMWTHLDRTAGGTLGGPVGGGIGVRGPGEKQLEMDRRIVERRIFELRQELKAIDARCQRQVRRRKESFPTVSIVGYTNAGKSSLMNRLTAAGVRAEDRLFVTLDTRTRAWTLRDGREVLLSDTVGFIRKLPHHLIASFRATLEEARNADVLIHTADVASPMVMEQIRSVNQVLEEIDCRSPHRILVLNKMDMLSDDTGLPLIRQEFGDFVAVSALTGQGIDALDAAVAKVLDSRQVEVEVEAPVGNGRLVSFLYEQGAVLSRTYEDTCVRVRVRLPNSALHQVARLGGQIVERSLE